MTTMAPFGTLDDDSVLLIASYGAAEDLLSLALTCRRLGSKRGAATGREWRMKVREGKRQKSTLREWSQMDEAARCAMEKSTKDWEMACLPLRDGENWSWMGRYHQLLLLRRPLTFDKLVATKKTDVYTNDSKSEVLSKNGTCGDALSDHVLRAGKHYASFNVTTCTGTGVVSVGVFRPTKGLDMSGVSDHRTLIQALNEEWTDGEVNYCALNLPNGFGFWSRPGFAAGLGTERLEWEGRASFASNDTVGLLLDLDEGTLAVYKNSIRLGILKSGLAGEYCWGTTMNTAESSIRIRRGWTPALHDIVIECFAKLGRCRDGCMGFRAVPEGRQFSFLHLTGLLCCLGRDPSPESNMVKKLSQWGLVVCLFDKDGIRVDSVRGRSDWDHAFFMVKHVAIKAEWSANPPDTGKPLEEIFPPMSDDQIRELNEDPSKVRQFLDDW